MAYNKTKYVDSALKYLHQGKLAQAISEYQQILKHEPKDQITLMTVGDLFVRLGDTFQALEYFERLAQIYLSDGFVTKAIAIYKKIAKLAPEESKPVERLAELYVQQGVLSEARPIYLQLAEIHQRANRPAQAAALLRKLLDAEPDNLRVQTKLAELALAGGQKAEAAAGFCAAARQLLARGDHAEAIKHVDRALQIEPEGAATVLKVRIHTASGNQKDAIALLEASSRLQEDEEATGLLLDLYLEAKEARKAEELASKVFARESKRFAPALHVATAFLESDQAERALNLMDLIREPMTDAGEHETLSQSLSRLAEKLPARIEPLQWLVELYGRTSDSFRLPDALANLGHAHEAAGDFDRALKAYEQLHDRDPENESARRQCERLRARLESSKEKSQADLGTSSREVAPPWAAAPAVPAAAPPNAPTPAAQGDDENQRLVTQVLTDVDLFSSYGLTQKAIDLLETLLHRVPQHPVALERLFDLYLGAGNDRRTAELAAELGQLYTERGDTAAADRFTELRRRFERAATVAPAEAAKPSLIVPAQEFAVPVVEAEPIAEPVSAIETATEHVAARSSVHEVDLSDEWAALAGEVEKAAPAAQTEGAAETVRAEPDHTAELPALEPASASDKAEAESEPEPEYLLELDASPSEAISLDDAGAAAAEADDILAALSADFDAAVPMLVGSRPEQAAPSSNESATPAFAAAEHAEVAVPIPEPTGPLTDVFNEFRADLGEAAADGDDLETHYNLGIAYREMGLLEDAISEFQKVAKANKAGRAFRYSMQCCTLLGLAFMERGQPSIAAMWYERALETPALDPETVLALRYDLGVAQEMAGDTSAARKSFSQVYGMNIDYRDVAERLAAIGKER